MNRKILILILCIFLISCASAYTRSSPQFTNSITGSGYYGGDYDEFDKGLCQEGQDFVLQIAPFGCEPVPVTSDLLEEQNVAVYCQLTATKINPVIDVEAIESVSFSGDYPEEVAGVGFYPAQSALGNKDTRLNSPILGNIGYAVVVLKQQENESTMPDVVVGNMSAKIKYDIKNAFGLEQASFYLPVLDDGEWDAQKSKYSFWNGQGYLRASYIGDDEARISVYRYDERVDSVELKEGKKSESIYFPGFDCLAGFELKLNDIENSGETALLDINGNLVEVVEGGKFLDNRCTLKEISDSGAKQAVEISCRQDERSIFSGSFNLEISPKIDLKIGDKKYEDLEIGQKISQNDKDEGIYLGYVGTLGSTGNADDVYAILLKGSVLEYGDSLSDAQLGKVADFNDVARKDIKGDDGTSLASKTKNLFIEINKESGSVAAKIKNFFSGWFGDTKYAFVMVEETEVFENKISIIGFSAPIDLDILNEKTSGGGTLGDLFNKAEADYREVVNSYEGVKKYPDVKGSKKLGEEALYNLIVLADALNQKAKMLDYCNEFNSNYYSEKSDSYYGKLYNDNGLCKNLFSLSSSELNSQTVYINGDYSTIKLISLHSPSVDEYGVEVSVTGDIVKSGNALRPGDSLPLEGDDSIILKEINEDYAVFTSKIDWEKTGGDIAKEFLAGSDFKVKRGEDKVVGNKYSIKLDKINLEKMAKVSVVPSIDDQYSYSNFSFAVGIEKRAIQLSPERVNQSIANLNDQIKDLQSLSDTLGTTVETLNAACLTTGTAFTLYNMLDNLDGTSIARKDVMEKWKEKCTKELGEESSDFMSLQDCYVKYAEDIENDVEERTNALQETNGLLKDLQDDCNAVVDSGIFGKQINTKKLKECLVPKVQTSLNSVNFDMPKDNSGEELISKNNFISGYVNEDLAIEDLRELHTLAKDGSSVAKEQLESLVKKIYNERKKIEGDKEVKSAALEAGYEMDIYGDEKAITGTYRGDKVTSDKIRCTPSDSDQCPSISEETPMQIVKYGKTQYLLLLASNGNSNYEITSAYSIQGYGENGEIQVYGDETDFINKKFKQFVGSDGKGYQNKYEQSLGEEGVVIRYYETGTGNPVPALVPFGKEEGWYALMTNVLSLKDKSSYDDSARVTNFYLCNVGENNIEENKGGDDICQSINLAYSGTHNNFPGLNEEEIKPILEDAVRAIEQATDQSGKDKVTIKVRNMGVKSWTITRGSPLVDTPEYECTNFMSVKQCQILFNVCDPVVCPSSRCNFGGAYPNKNVVQSGIIGSLLLCLPNYKQGIYVPICLTGVKAGLDGWMSILKSHKACLEENLKTGKMTGTCDELYSVYACEFFWKQALPLAKIGIPKLIQAMLGEGTTGGGEYLSVQSAFDTAQQSAQYFLSYYQTDSNKFLQVDSFEDFIGDEVCKAYVSGIYPETSLLDSLTNPESPAQFHGRFESDVMTTATNPPTSHYKVFYHIYSGENNGATYKVYLKSSDDGGYYQDARGILDVDSGYITTGETVSQTKDFTAPSGYSQLCINVNGQEECGYNEVSTSFAVDFIKDQYLATQANQTNINSEEDCLSSSANLYSAIGLNPQTIADNAIDQSIYELGIVRVCATESPGDRIGEGSRWKDVGDCSDTMKCWIDMNSVENVIENLDLKSELVDEMNEEAYNKLEESKGVLSESDYKALMEKIKDNEPGANERVELINNAIDKIYWDYQRGNLIFERGRAWGDIAEEEGMVIIERLKEEKKAEGKNGKITNIERLKEIYGKDEDEVKKNLVTINFVEKNIKVHKLVKDDFEKVNKAISECNTDYSFNSLQTFNWRTITDSNILSLHSFGIAIDINPDENPFCPTWLQCGDKNKLITDIPRCVVDAFKDNGFSWGGDWESVKDPMHFEYITQGVNNEVSTPEKGEKVAEADRIAYGEGDIDIGEIMKIDSSFSVADVEFIRGAENCNDCLESGWFDAVICDDDLCEAIGSELNVECVFELNIPGGRSCEDYERTLLSPEESDFISNAKTCDECGNSLSKWEDVECTAQICDAIGEALGVNCEFNKGANFFRDDTCNLNLNSESNYECDDLLNYMITSLEDESSGKILHTLSNYRDVYRPILDKLIDNECIESFNPNGLVSQTLEKLKELRG